MIACAAESPFKRVYRVKGELPSHKFKDYEEALSCFYELESQGKTVSLTEETYLTVSDYLSYNGKEELLLSSNNV